ncbi:MAG TPA: Gfo/Idh/MocA family oxidoreductase [Chloroflexota bacterium]|nr:Gfo/Idh/MocA family oxidoreductase [Chloroflexota bacterium]
MSASPARQGPGQPGQPGQPGVEPLRSIHVGVGTRGASHLRAALESGYWRPVALVDVVPEYLAAARELTGLPESACYTRLEGALEAVPSDAVVVASPVTLHAAQILSGLGAGRHVLTEKCFTVGLADAVACVEAAERHGRRLMVVQNARLSPPMRTLRRLIAEGTYGPLGLFTQTFFKARGGPYNLSPHMHLWQQGVHELDTLLAVLQRPVRRVWGLSTSPAWCDWPTPSTVQAVLECEGGLSGTHLSTSNARAGGFEMRLECAAAALVARDRTWGPIEVHWGPGGRRSETLPPDAPDTRGLEQHPAAKEVLADPQAAGRALGRLIDMAIYRDFFEYVSAGREPESSGRRNLQTVRLLDAIQRSSEAGRPVEMEAQPDEAEAQPAPGQREQRG